MRMQSAKKDADSPKLPKLKLKLDLMLGPRLRAKLVEGLYGSFVWVCTVFLKMFLKSLAAANGSLQLQRSLEYCGIRLGGCEPVSFVTRGHCVMIYICVLSFAGSALSLLPSL